MHGRIVQYSHATGAGIIINASKKLFDFKLSHWHDNTKIPEVDLLVDFRLEEDNPNNVIDVKSSKYQEFDENSIIKERDFWKTKTDEELEKLESGIFEGLVIDAYKQTNYAKLANIKESISIDVFIKYHFENEVQIIRSATKLPTKGGEKFDYRIVNRFLKRTLDTLIYTDRRVTRDTFSIYLQVLSKLHYFITPFYKAQQESKKVFVEKFLPQQLYFSAAQRKLLNIKDDLLRINNRKHSIKSEIYSINIKLSAPNKNEAALKERIKKLNAQYSECAKNEVELNQTRENTERLIEAFISAHKKPFIERFSATRDDIFEQIKNALNVTITSLDDKIWELGMKSEPVINHFFKLETNFSFCTLSFMHQYLKTLDMGKLSDNDRLLNIYITRYKERNSKHVLVFSNDEKLKMKLKIDILKKYKNFIVTSISKKTEYTIMITNKKFDFVLIDMSMEGEKPIELIINGKSTRFNKNAHFVLYSPPPKK